MSSNLYVVKIEDGKPTEGVMKYDAMRRLFPNTSFPAVPSLELLSSYGFAPWLTVPKPYPSEKKVVIPGEPLLIDGVYHQVWTERDMDAEELAVATAQKLIEVKQTRTNYLYDCDWTQLADAPLTAEKKAEWAAYRQALRDLPLGISDPFDVSWPVKPQ